MLDFEALPGFCFDELAAPDAAEAESGFFDCEAPDAFALPVLPDFEDDFLLDEVLAPVDCGAPVDCETAPWPLACWVCAGFAVSSEPPSALLAAGAAVLEISAPESSVASLSCDSTVVHSVSVAAAEAVLLVDDLLELADAALAEPEFASGAFDDANVASDEVDADAGEAVFAGELAF